VNKLEFTGEVKKHDLRPGDVIVLRSAGPLSLERADRIKHLTESLFPGHQCIVLPDDLDLEVIRPEAVA
jgi:hypothetical protein